MSCKSEPSHKKNLKKKKKKKKKKSQGFMRTKKY